VVRVEHDHDALCPLRAARDLLDDAGIDGRSLEVGDAPVPRPPSGRADVHRDDLAVAEQVAHAGHVVGASPEVGPRLHDQVGARLDEDLLIGPEVECALSDRDTEPERLLPRRVVRVVEDPMEGLEGVVSIGGRGGISVIGAA
jgi:hypothetical protein